MRLTVRDFGVGLPAESKKIFEQFFSTKRDGLGMGLVIARSIIEAHGGRLFAENVEGGGACFQFSLPASNEFADMNPPGSLVLLVDDDPSVRRGLRRLLLSAGYSVEVFESAAEFLAREPHVGPSCLILDIRMPGLNGLDLQEALTRQSRDEQIVFITGHADVPMSVHAMKAGAVDFLPKPFDNEALLRAVEHALARSAERHSNAPSETRCDRGSMTLTPREFEVLQFVIAGLLNKQIGAELGVAEKTIKVHRGHVMEKLGVKSVAELVRLAEKAGVSSARPRQL